MATETVSVSVVNIVEKPPAGPKFGNAIINMEPGMPPDPHPPAAPGFKCKCKKCYKVSLLTPTAHTPRPETLEMFQMYQKLYLNFNDDSCYLKVIGGEAENNVILKTEHLKKNSDSSIIFIDMSGQIILKTERVGRKTTVESDGLLIGEVRGAPGSCLNFDRSFTVTTISTGVKLYLKARGPCVKLLCCSCCNAYYLTQFLITDSEKQELGKLKCGSKKQLASLEFAPAIMNDAKSKAQILAAALTIFELFFEPHMGWNVGQIGWYYIIFFGVPTTAAICVSLYLAVFVYNLI